VAFPQSVEITPEEQGCCQWIPGCTTPVAAPAALVVAAGSAVGSNYDPSRTSLAFRPGGSYGGAKSLHALAYAKFRAAPDGRSCSPSRPVILSEAVG
jgi:hypothetical protein